MEFTEQMDLLQQLVFLRTYSKLQENGKKESLSQTFDRYQAFMEDTYPAEVFEIAKYMNYIRNGSVLPSLRLLQFAGDAVKRENLRAFNCFSGDTEFVTSSGISRFNEHKSGDIVEVLSDKGVFRKATVVNFGKSLLYKLTMKKGHTEHIIYTTENHRWFTIINKGTSTIRVEKTTNNLQVGDKFAQITKTFDTQLCPIAIQHGIVFGDGTFDGKQCKITLCSDSVELEKYFYAGKINNHGKLNGEVRADRLLITNLPWNWKKLPDINANNEYLIGFLAGWFSADGSINKKGSTLTLDCKDENKLRWAKSAFAKCGIVTGPIKLLRKLSPFDGSEKPLYRLFLYPSGFKKEFFLKSLHSQRFNETDRTARWKVVSVEKTDRYEDVWCVQEPETKSFCLSNFVLTGNCSFLNITNIKCFSDVLYLSACGTGVGFSCKKRHINQLPTIELRGQNEFLIEDNKESWANSVSELINNPETFFYYHKIRPSGAPLSSGGFASGADPLRECHEKMRKILLNAVGRQLLPIEVHSIVCSIADCIVSGGVRRSALISLFDKDDADMLAAKADAWWEKNGHFARANNSAHMDRVSTTYEEFAKVYDACINSNSGEPGFDFTNNMDEGFNPCNEVALRDRQMCNLTEIIVTKCPTKEDFKNAALAATYFGTLQAGLTNYNYVSEMFAKNGKEEALLGVSITGQAQRQEIMSDGEFLQATVKEMLDFNALVAKRIGINPSARMTTTKPSGSASAVAGCSSGIHAAHSEYYIRRVRIAKIDPVVEHLRVSGYPESLIEDDKFKPSDVVVAIPQAMPGAVTRDDETAIQLLERMKHLTRYWIKPGHRSGDNTHNCSITVNYKSDEVEDIKAWLWENRDVYAGVSLLPFSDSTYEQAPFEAITKAQYDAMAGLIPVGIDLLGGTIGGLDERNAVSGCEGSLCSTT
jgi:ribonucleoside-diphosphate reductase alpha chain